ncbi:GNAT family N-acetyltransferase, partial [Paraburkholderia ginsengiterrae]|uniref:GNAT family N-acetyltransferase n=1 Tax=Paraburkholderia ginsengiterrae TaxID=1462993 RepID=UPI0030FE4D95
MTRGGRHPQFADKRAARRAFVGELWVAPPARHLRGGALLVDTAITWPANEGAPEIYALVAAATRTAILSYEALGLGPTVDHPPFPRAPLQVRTPLFRRGPTPSPAS